MATTTNYGWTTPDDTALVKDGASAIRTLGSSVDTTTKNLNPETTLGDLSFRSSTSNVNTRIPIGSSGQHLTVVAGVPAWSTASDQTPLTTKGDLFTFTTLDARLGVGANNTVLTADSAEASGLKWAAPASGSFNGVRVFNSTTQNISNATNTAITFNSESYDTNSYHDTSSNTSRLTVPTTGYYRFEGVIFVDINATGGRYLEIKKNGTGIQAVETGASTQASVATSLVFHAQLSATAGDYFELFLYQTSGGTLNTYNATTAYNHFSAQFLGA